MEPDEQSRRQYEFENFVRAGVVKLQTQMVQMLEMSSASARIDADHEKRLSANEGLWQALSEELRAIRADITALRAELAPIKEQRSQIIGGSRAITALLMAISTVIGWAISVWLKL